MAQAARDAEETTGARLRIADVRCCRDAHLWCLSSKNLNSQA